MRKWHAQAARRLKRGGRHEDRAHHQECALIDSPIIRDENGFITFHFAVMFCTNVVNRGAGRAFSSCEPFAQSLQSIKSCCSITCRITPLTELERCGTV